MIFNLHTMILTLESDLSAHDASCELYEMFLAFWKAPFYHLALEAFLLLMIIWLIFHKSYKPQRTELTEKEKDALIAEWVPEPLVPDSNENHYALKPRICQGKMGKMVNVDGQLCLNAATHNYLGLVEHPKLEEAAIKCLRKYGVGSCGPRGFYGTVDIHLELENRLSKFMRVEETVLYSYGFSTISSAIPAYAKHGDIIFCDHGVNFAIQKGLVASRSQLRYFKHNDMEDLERLLLEQDHQDKLNPTKAKVIRRFLVVEGLYMNHGDICPLPKLVELKNRFKVRLFIDEACSFGVLGSSGRGVTEHYDISMSEIDLITATLEGAIPSYGGFCCGTSFVMDHQAGVAIAGLDILESSPELVKTLRDNCILMHKKLLQISELQTKCEAISPIKHLYLVDAVQREEAVQKLDNIINYAMTKGVALTQARYLDAEEHQLPSPSIRLIVTAAFTAEDIDKIVEVVQDAFQNI